MTREERIKVCETCKHCQMDIEHGILCGFTNEYADFDGIYHLYEPSNKQQAKIREQIIDRMKESCQSIYGNEMELSFMFKANLPLIGWIYFDL